MKSAREGRQIWEANGQREDGQQRVQLLDLTVIVFSLQFPVRSPILCSDHPF